MTIQHNLRVKQAGKFQRALSKCCHILFCKCRWAVNGWVWETLIYRVSVLWSCSSSPCFQSWCQANWLLALNLEGPDTKKHISQNVKLFDLINYLSDFTFNVCTRGPFEGNSGSFNKLEIDQNCIYSMQLGFFNQGFSALPFICPVCKSQTTTNSWN